MLYVIYDIYICINIYIYMYIYIYICIYMNMKPVLPMLQKVIYYLSNRIYNDVQ